MGDGKITPLSVSEVNNQIKSVVENNETLRNLPIKGEISNLKVAQNGHLYFSLKDEKSMISVIIWKNDVANLETLPQDGDKVVIIGDINLYAPRGVYNIIAWFLTPVGKGEILDKLELLKKRLQEEGLFDQSRKKEIVKYPSAIGIITAPNSAAIKDIIINLKRRYPIVDIYFFPSQVQGDNAPKELVQAFLTAQKYPLDTIIIGRGGGASEDLSAFNDEKLVRTIAESKIPVIAAIGHEIDSTLVDYVADKRASTPTGAAELATPDRNEIKKHFENCVQSMNRCLRQYSDSKKKDVAFCKVRIREMFQSKITNLKQKIILRSDQLESLSPKKILQRGYSISLDEKGKPIVDASTQNVGNKIRTIYAKGETISAIEEVKGE